MMAQFKGVKDAVHDLYLVIQKEDRIGACQRDPSKCVIANALRRQPGVVDPRVGALYAYVAKSNGWTIRYEISPDSRANVRAFDEGEQIMPVDSRVKLVPPRKPLGSRAGEGRRGSNKKSLDGKHVTTRKPSSRHLWVDPHVED
jgi:hypothetical protein